MIRDLSLTLQAILEDPALNTSFPELTAAQIVFDRPVETFNPTQTTIDLFLYDIRENMELRSNEPTMRRLNGQVELQRPPLRVACSYLITAWPIGGTDLALQEHRLLSQVLQVLSPYRKIPAPFLRGQLVGQEPPLPLLIAQTDGLKEPAEFWTAIGNKLRPSLTVTVTIGMEVFAPVTAPIVITEELRLGERTARDAEAISQQEGKRMPPYLSPGVYVEEVPSAVKAIAGVSTSTAGFIGIVPNTLVIPVDSVTDRLIGTGTGDPAKTTFDFPPPPVTVL